MRSVARIRRYPWQKEIRMTSRREKIETYKKKHGWGYQIIYIERGRCREEGDLIVYSTEALAKQAAQDALAKLALRWNLLYQPSSKR
jgi:hypothetical protein